MRRLILLASAAVLAGCPPAEAPPAEEAEMAPATLSLADLAGRWTLRSMLEGGDSVIATSELVATADTTGWTAVFPNRDPIPVRVLAVAGDSVVTEQGPFESVLRAGVMVTVTTVSRLQDGRLVGTFVARYQTTGADSVLRGRIEGSRMP